MRDPKATAADLTNALRGACGEALNSVLLYGSVPRGEAIAEVSDINVLVLLEDTAPGSLRTIAPLARRWARAGNTAPLLLTPAEWRSAANVFAVELADMIDAHEVLHGENPLHGLEPGRDALRFQSERELRGKLLQLRSGATLLSDEPAELGRLLLTALPSFTTYLRAALRLADGGKAPATTPEVIEAGCRLVGASPDAFGRCWEARKGNRSLLAKLEGDLASQYYETAERMAVWVDAFNDDGGS